MVAEDVAVKGQCVAVHQCVTNIFIANEPAIGV